jgi:hypothetical protein
MLRGLSTGTLPLSSRQCALVESPLFGYDSAAIGAGWMKRTTGQIRAGAPQAVRRGRAKYRLPGIYWTREYVGEGGLLAYTADMTDLIQ